MRQPIVRVLLNEVPNLFVRAILHGKGALLVLDLAGAERIVSLVLFLIGPFLVSILLRKNHSSSLALLMLILLDTLMDPLDVQHA